MQDERRSIRDRISKEPTQAPEILARRPRKKGERDRTWEERQRQAGRVVTYRDLPAEVHEAVKTIAGELGVKVGEVARAFLEYALEAYRDGRLKLEPKEATMTRTLYPEE